MPGMPGKMGRQAQGMGNKYAKKDFFQKSEWTLVAEKGDLGADLGPAFAHGCTRNICS